LQGIDFAEFTKITKLDYLTTAKNLEEVTLSGEMTLDTLRPLSKTKIKKLRIGFKKLLDDEVKYLTEMKFLEELDLGTNRFTTEQFAWLAATIPAIKCEQFNAYVPLSDNEVLVVGKGKPILNLEKDKDRIEKYVINFEKLVKQYKK
jgi:hypothetical protein